MTAWPCPSIHLTINSSSCLSDYQQPFFFCGLPASPSYPSDWEIEQSFPVFLIVSSPSLSVSLFFLIRQTVNDQA